MIYYKLIKVIIETLGLAKVIINIMIKNYNLFNSILIN